MLARIKVYQLSYLILLMILLFLLSSCTPKQVTASPSITISYEQAAAQQAFRWQAMADFYEAHNLLNEPFDYEQAAAQQAFRWQAMADFYESHSMLTTTIN